MLGGPGHAISAVLREENVGATVTKGRYGVAWNLRGYTRAL